MPMRIEWAIIERKPMERQRSALVLVSRRSVAAVKGITTMPSQLNATATSTTNGVVALHRDSVIIVCIESVTRMGWQ